MWLGVDHNDPKIWKALMVQKLKGLGFKVQLNGDLDVEKLFHVAVLTLCTNMFVLFCEFGNLCISQS